MPESCAPASPSHAAWRSTRRLPDDSLQLLLPLAAECQRRELTSPSHESSSDAISPINILELAGRYTRFLMRYGATGRLRGKRILFCAISLTALQLLIEAIPSLRHRPQPLTSRRFPPLNSVESSRYCLKTVWNTLSTTDSTLSITLPDCAYIDCRCSIHSRAYQREISSS